MNQPVKYLLPFALNVQNTVFTLLKLAELPSNTDITIDISQLQHCEPFGLLALGSAIRSLKQRIASTGNVFRLIGRDHNRQGHRFADSMGFWQSIGEEAAVSTDIQASEKYIRITKVTITDLYRSSGGFDPIRAKIISKKAEQLADVLTDGKQDEIWIALEYAFREMLRNAIEHGRSDFWIAGWARYLQEFPDVQVAVLDEGKGIRASLCENPLYTPQSDLQAIRLALEPGVSRNKGKARSAAKTQELRESFPEDDPEKWDNAGFGLTLATQLARHAGQYAVLSGNMCVAWADGEFCSLSSFNGTAVRLSFEPRRLPHALKAVFPDGLRLSRMSASQSLRLGRFSSQGGTH